ncbi:MAG TPA: PAS domain-containing protein [Methanotrichaceae archaeon]|nr:PAS domain-containing protein [Methanotrichaceae archaeon]
MDIVNGDDFDMLKGALNLDMDKELYRAIIDNALQGLAIIQNSEVIFANGILAEITGYALEELQSLSSDALMSLVHPEDRNRVLEVVVDGISQNLSPLCQEFRIIRQDGTTVWVDARANFIEYQGKPAIQVAFVDITKRKLMEEGLKDNEKKYRLLVDNASDVIWIFDLNTRRFTYVSPSIQRLRGYTVKEAMLQSLADVLDQDSLAMIEADISARLQRFYSGDETSRVQTYVVKQPCKDGSLISVEIATTLLTDEKGEVNEVLGVSRDITQRKQVENYLQEREERFRKIFELSPIGIQLFNSDGFLVNANTVGQKIISVAGSTPSGKCNLFRDILPNGETQAKLQSGQIVNVGRWVEMRSDEAAKEDSDKASGRNVRTYIDYFITSLGKASAPEGYLVLLQDLTERKLAEEALISENERLQIIYDIWRTRVQTSNLRIEE